MPNNMQGVAKNGVRLLGYHPPFHTLQKQKSLGR